MVCDEYINFSNFPKRRLRCIWNRKIASGIILLPVLPNLYHLKWTFKGFSLRR